MSGLGWPGWTHSLYRISWNFALHLIPSQPAVWLRTEEGGSTGTWCWSYKLEQKIWPGSLELWWPERAGLELVELGESEVNGVEPGLVRALSPGNSTQDKTNKVKCRIFHQHRHTAQTVHTHHSAYACSGFIVLWRGPQHSNRSDIKIIFTSTFR